MNLLALIGACVRELPVVHDPIERILVVPLEELLRVDPCLVVPLPQLRPGPTGPGSPIPRSRVIWYDSTWT